MCGSNLIKGNYEIRYVDPFCGFVGDYNYTQIINSCQNCNLIFTQNPVDDDILDVCYKYLSKYEAEDEIGVCDYSVKKMYERQYRFINENIADYSSVLEIGAATGENLVAYKRDGKRVLGIEPSENNKKYAKEHFDIDLEAKTFNEWYNEGVKQSFDLVFMSHVLEHIVDFNEMIKRIDDLNPIYCFIEVPFAENKGAGVEPYGMFTIEHVNYFSVESLSYLMSENGYDLIAQDKPNNMEGTNPGYPTLMTLWGKTKSIKNNHIGMIPREFDAGSLLDSYCFACKTEFDRIRDIIDKIDSNRKLAIWGAGTHTSRLLGMTSLLEKKVICIYDSDKKKHGHNMCKIPIRRFVLNDVLCERVDTVLISSHASEKAIEKTIRGLIGNAELTIIKLYS